jgi:hypothetical protein
MLPLVVIFNNGIFLPSFLSFCSAPLAEPILSSRPRRFSWAAARRAVKDERMSAGPGLGKSDPRSLDDGVAGACQPVGRRVLLTRRCPVHANQTGLPPSSMP